MPHTSLKTFSCLVFLASASIVAAEPVPADVLAKYAGEYSAKCQDPTALRARIAKDGLSLIRGPKSVTGIYELKAISYFGKETPANFDYALLSNIKGGGSITFVMFNNKSGPMVDLEADQAVLKRVGIAKRGTVKYRRC